MGIIISPPVTIFSGSRGRRGTRYLDPVEAEFTRRKTGGDTSIGKGKAKIDKIKGKSLVWNQLIDFVALGGNSGVAGGLTYRRTGRTSYHISGTKNGESTFHVIVVGTSLTLKANHTYLMMISGDPQSKTKFYSNTESRYSTDFSAKVFTASSNLSTWWNIRCEYNDTSVVDIDVNINMFDLTLMGLADSITTADQFKALYPLPYYEYNAGEIISNKTESLGVTGFNQWDEEWENGRIDPSTGEDANNNNGLRSKNYIPVLSGTSYYYRKGETGANMYACYYDNDKQFISYDNCADVSVTTPAACKFVRFYIPTTAAVASYQHDICINLSDPSRNGTYDPYKTNTIELNLPTLTGKLNGEGESVAVFPDGLKSVGSVYDEIVGNKAIKRIGVVDLGTLTWTYTTAFANPFFQATLNLIKPSSASQKGPILCGKYTTRAASVDYGGQTGISTFENNVRIFDASYTSAATFKTAMNGVIAYYELATPEEYELDTPLPKEYKVWSGGTEERLPRDTSSEVSAPVRYDVLYPEPED